MPRNALVAIIVILVLGAGAAVYYQNQNKNGVNSPVSSIKEALSPQSVSMECSYTDDQKRTVKTYIKNGSVRSDYTGATAAQTGSMIVANKKMYTWTTDKKGFMMDIPDVSVTPSKVTATNPTMSQDEEMMKNVEKYKQYCKNATVADYLFTPPADVTFQDYSQMMKKVPTGAAGSGMSKEQMEQYMQKYGQQK